MINLEIVKEESFRSKSDLRYVDDMARVTIEVPKIELRYVYKLKVILDQRKGDSVYEQ